MSRCEKWIAVLLLAYLAGGFVTNAYCRTYRWNDWRAAGADVPETRTFFATALWPGYIAARTSTWLVETTPKLIDCVLNDGRECSEDVGR